MSVSPPDARPTLSSFSSGASTASSSCSRCSCHSSTRPDPSSSAEPTTGPSNPHQHRGHAFLTRSDLGASLEAHDTLLAAAKDFRLACMAKAKAGATFAGALDGCSRVKGADASGPGLQAAAGFHYVLSSSERVIADRLYKTFEIPLLETRDAYHLASADRSSAYAHALAERTRRIRETEEGHLRPSLSRAQSGAKEGAGKAGGGRNLSMLKETLRTLQQQVEELERVKGEYYEEVLEAEQVLWSTILSRTGTVLKAQLASTATLGAKADDQVVAQVLSTSPDPFDVDDDDAKPKDAGVVLTSLPPSVGASAAGSPSASRPSSAPSTPKPPSTPLPSESRTASLFGEADDRLDQEVEALLSPRGTRSVSGPGSMAGSFIEEETPKKAAPRPDPSTEDDDSSSSSDDSSADDDDDDDDTISPASHQPLQRKTLPFPLLASTSTSAPPPGASVPALAQGSGVPVERVA